MAALSFIPFIILSLPSTTATTLDNAHKVASKIQRRSCQIIVKDLLNRAESKPVETFSPVKPARLTNGLFGQVRDSQAIAVRADSLQEDEVDIVFGPEKGRVSFQLKGKLVHADFGQYELAPTPWGNSFQAVGFRMRLPKEKIDLLKNDTPIQIDREFFQGITNIRPFIVDYPTEVISRDQIKRIYIRAKSFALGFGLFSAFAPWAVILMPGHVLNFYQTFLLMITNLYLFTMANSIAGDLADAHQEILEQDKVAASDIELSKPNKLLTPEQVRRLPPGTKISNCLNPNETIIVGEEPLAPGMLDTRFGRTVWFVTPQKTNS